MRIIDLEQKRVPSINMPLENNDPDLGKAFASGTVTSSSNTQAFTVDSGSTANFSTLTISGLTKQPKRIVVEGITYAELNIYDSDTYCGGNSNTHYSLSTGTGTQYKIQAVSPLSVTSTGFTLPVWNTNATYQWYAYL